MIYIFLIMVFAEYLLHVLLSHFVNKFCLQSSSSLPPLLIHAMPHLRYKYQMCGLHKIDNALFHR